MSQLQVHGLKKHYGSRVVVKDVSLEVTSGEVVGLLGPNGAGKTTCFYMIVGLISVDDGAIHLDGREISHLAMHSRARMGLSYLPQEASVFRKLTVEENIRAVLELQELPEEEIESRLSGLLRDLNIAHLRQSTALSLSGGERRRVEIARALPMKQTLQLKLSQHLTLTPQLQQSIRLLQLSTLELNQELEKFLAENPLLEREDADAPAPSAPTQMNGESATTLEPSAEHSETESQAQADTDTYSAELDWVGQSGSSAGVRDDSDENDYSQVAADSPNLREHLHKQL